MSHGTEPTPHARRWFDRRGRFGAVVAIVAVAALSAVAIAQAKVISFNGKGEDDPQVRVRFDAKVQLDEHRRAEAAWIEDFVADNVEFKCESTGYSGRGDYTFPNDRIKVDGDGEFRDTYERKVGDHVIDRFKLKGQTDDRFGGVKVRGWFKVERSEGGLEFGGCVTDRTDFKAFERIG